MGNVQYILVIFSIILLVVANIVYPSSENEKTINKIKSAYPPELYITSDSFKNKNNNEGKPIMHTFYDPLSKTKSTGMSNADDRHLLETWSEAWKAAGWSTKILVLADAQKHKDYEKYKKMLESNTDGVYNQMCFLRWLAMATEGGWMSDYDVFPIPTRIDFLKPTRKSDTLPNNGTMTVYEFTRDGGVPSLVSGTAEEWDRLGRLLIEKSNDDDIGSDMFALINVKKSDPRAFILGDKVLKGHIALKNEKMTKNSCKIWFGYAAVHFSHFSIEKGKENGALRKTTGPTSRPQIGADWMKEWIKVCGD